MALTPTGARYRNQGAIQRRDRELGEALDDIASQGAQIRVQGNYGFDGPPLAPHPITSIAVSGASGFATVALTHTNAPPGVKYIVQYATTPNFQNPIPVDNGSSLVMHKYLKGLTLYFRAAPQFPASPLAPWVYFGGQTTPTPVAF